MGLQKREYDDFVAMIQQASNVSVKEKAKTFFDVAGYPHYENVISNILAFFFNTREEHGLKDLWLKSLLDCYNCKAKTSIWLGEFEDIEREHSTEENKRLDIIILLSNAIVAIENKVYANADNNPFDKYHEEVLSYKNDMENKTDAEIIEVLLSVNTLNNQTTRNGANFYNVTYTALIEKVEENLGHYVLDADEKWLIFMKELLKNIKNIGERGMVNLEWQKFLKENKIEIEKFLNNYSKDISTKIEYVHSIYDILKLKIEEDTQIKANIPQMGLYGVKKRESFKRYFSIYIDIKKGEETIVLEPYVSRQNPSCLKLALWNRETNKKDWSKEIELLKSDFPDVKQVVEDSWSNCLSLEEIDFANNIPLEEIANKLFGIINKLI